MKKASFLNSVAYNDEKPAVSLLLETDFSKEIQIVFKKGQKMNDHKAPHPITVQVLKGIIDFGIENHIEKLISGNLVALSENVVHNLTAVEDSIVRLTLSKLDSVNSVEKI